MDLRCVSDTDDARMDLDCASLALLHVCSFLLLDLTRFWFATALRVGVLS